MRRRLAGGFYTVVAGLAGAGHSGMVHAGRSPAKFRMAIVAGVAALYVSGIFLGRCNGAGLAVTTCAAGGRSPEYAVGMAGLAADSRMRTVQQKPGCIVVEFRCGLR